MSVFPAEGVQFLGELASHNNREWFAEHKGDFEAQVQLPGQAVFEGFKKLLAEMLECEVEGKPYRIHRDVRFSKDKTPYSPHVRFSAWKLGDDPKTDVCFHASIEADKQVIGFGIWEFDPETLSDFRARVETGEVDKLLANIGSIRLSEPELKRIPKDVNGTSDHFRRKGLVVWIDIPWDSADVEIGNWAKNLVRLKTAFQWRPV